MLDSNELLTKIELVGLWAYFHKDWLLQIRSQLREQIPPEYHVFVESETLLVSPDDPQFLSVSLPDIAVAGAGRSKAEENSSDQLPAATAAVIEVEEPCEVFSKYTLLIRRAPENLVVAALELLSPSNKGIDNRFDQEKHLRKRASFLESAVNLLEIDALIKGERRLPESLSPDLAKYERIAWTASHYDGRRKLRGWGWNQNAAPPSVRWTIDGNLDALVNLQSTLLEAFHFNRWEDIVTSAERKPR